MDTTSASNTEHRSLTPEDVWHLLSEGCNTHEIATYAGVSQESASAMVSRATTLYARAAA